MFWLILVVMVAVLGVAALVALGNGGSLEDASQDRIAVQLPAERPLSRQDVDELRLPMALRGYRMDEVDEVLDRLGAELSARDARIATLELSLAGAGAPAAARGSAPAPETDSAAAPESASEHDPAADPAQDADRATRDREADAGEEQR